jgi:modulator of FtsH protease
MNEWHDFFLAQAGAAGVLTGLVFVGVSINLQKIVSDPRSGLAGRAAEALILLVAVLVASVLVLVPAQGAGVLGAEVLVVGLATWVWIAAIQLPRMLEWTTMRADLRVSFVLRVVLGQVATLALVIAGVALLWVGPGGLYWLVASTVIAILGALSDAWVLLVEINR